MKQTTAAETPEQVTQEELAMIHAARRLGASPSSGQPWGLVILWALSSLVRGGYGELTVKVHGNEIRECVKSEKLRSVDAA